MTAPTWTNRSLPLAERVRLAMLDWDMDDATEAHRTDLLAAIAATDRLARAAVAWYAAVDESPLPDYGMSVATAAEYEMDQAEEAYRARMAQGVGDG